MGIYNYKNQYPILNKKTQDRMILFIKGRLKSFKYAFRGTYFLIKTEHSIMTQIFIFSLTILAGLMVGISKQDWINQTLAMGLVLGIEGMNTAVEKLSDFIGSQMGYPTAYELPEYSKEESGSSSDTSIEDRDSMFNEAARVIVSNQQGSASLLQRKLKLGYNRAGRLIDQMEDAGIVGPFEGSKPRQVLISDLNSLETLLSENQK